jgi:hypothetical protein
MSNENPNVELVEVATQTEKQYQLPDGKVVDIQGYLIWLGNIVLEVKRSVA